MLLSDKIFPTQQLFLHLQGCEKHKGAVQPVFWLLAADPFMVLAAISVASNVLGALLDNMLTVQFLMTR